MSNLNILNDRISELKEHLNLAFVTAQIGVDRLNYLKINANSKQIKKHNNIKGLIEIIEETLGLKYTEKELLQMITFFKKKDSKGHWYIAESNDRICCGECFQKLKRSKGEYYMPWENISEEDMFQWEVDFHTKI